MAGELLIEVIDIARFRAIRPALDGWTRAARSAWSPARSSARPPRRATRTDASPSWSASCAIRSWSCVCFLSPGRWTG
jgi:hypothetical protein